MIDETVLEDEPECHLGWRKSRDLPPIRIGAKLVCRGTNVNYRETEHLRVLIANERRDRLALVAPIVAALGHEVIAREIEVEDVAPSRPGSDQTSRSSASARALPTRSR